VIATHFHPDHVGLAGWLTERFGLPLYMSAMEYFVSLSRQLDQSPPRIAAYQQFIHKDIKSRNFRYHLPCQVLHFSQRGKICPAKLNALVACRLLDFTHGFQTTLGVATVQKKPCAMF
jgi:hypothetical protein